MHTSLRTRLHTWLRTWLRHACTLKFMAAYTAVHGLAYMAAYKRTRKHCMHTSKPCMPDLCIHVYLRARDTNNIGVCKNPLTLAKRHHGQLSNAQRESSRDGTVQAQLELVSAGPG